MKALILVGGFGTRLRPLTLTCPKPLVDFANKPMLIHQLEALKDAGVTEVVLAIAYRAEVMKAFLAEWEAKLGLKIHCSEEDEPLGTAGPLKLAESILDDGSNEPFFVMNSDVICEYPLASMLAFHKERNAEATVLVTKVEDPSKYGVVLMDGMGKIDRFVEKPKEFVGDKINAGIYVCQPSVLGRIELRPTSIEREVFPFIARDHGLYSFVLPGFWMDIGQPKDYLTGLSLFLQSKGAAGGEGLAPAGAGIKGDVLIHPSATVGEDCLIGPDVCIGEGCVIGRGVRISNAVVMKGCKLKDFSMVHDSIVGWHSSVGRWCRVVGKTVMGEDVHVKEEVLLNGAVVLPHKEIKASVLEAKIIL